MVGIKVVSSKGILPVNREVKDMLEGDGQISDEALAHLRLLFSLILLMSIHSNAC